GMLAPRLFPSRCSGVSMLTKNLDAGHANGRANGVKKRLKRGGIANKKVKPSAPVRAEPPRAQIARLLQQTPVARYDRESVEASCARLNEQGMSPVLAPIASMLAHVLNSEHPEALHERPAG